MTWKINTFSGLRKFPLMPSKQVPTTGGVPESPLVSTTGGVPDSRACHGHPGKVQPSMVTTNSILNSYWWGSRI